jgi:hypothetical protein
VTTKPKAIHTEADVCDDIAMRQALGINKYGQTVRENPLSLRAWLQHAYEECLDQAIYLKRAIEEQDKQTPLFPDLPTTSAFGRLIDGNDGA